MSASIGRDEPLRMGRPEELFDFPSGASVSLYSAGFEMHPDERLLEATSLPIVVDLEPPGASFAFRSAPSEGSEASRASWSPDGRHLSFDARSSSDPVACQLRG